MKIETAVTIITSEAGKVKDFDRYICALHTIATAIKKGYKLVKVDEAIKTLEAINDDSFSPSYYTGIEEAIDTFKGNTLYAIGGLEE